MIKITTTPIMPVQTESIPEHITKLCEESVKKFIETYEKKIFGEPLQIEYNTRLNFGVNKSQFYKSAFILNCGA